VILQPEELRKIIQQILSEDSSEICCTDCCKVLDQFAEIKMNGNIPALVMPMVQEHLNHCENCQEQLMMLLDALKAFNGDQV
jgi:hypothetical protein